MEEAIFTALSGLVGGRVFPDVAPAKTPRPYITYQQVGGRGVNFVDPTIPDRRNARVQVSVWGDSRLAVAGLARQVEDALRATVALHTVVLGAPVAMYDEVTALRGSRQDFSLWS